MATNGTSIRIGEFSEEHLLKRAREIVEKKVKGATVFDKEAEDRIPKFETSELDLGRVLGRGGFCVVSEITKVHLNDGSKANPVKHDDHDDDHHFISVVQDRNFMQTHCIRKGKDARYAIKKLQESTMKDPYIFVNGVVDLAIEARFLAVIRHPNIIKMRAVAAGTPFTSSYFVVLDRLYDILTTRLTYWKKRKVSGISKLLDRKGKKQIAFWLERITVAHDLACALKYLHSLNIVYRDLKPDNIGFDVRGDVKIFDFGLAKEIRPETMVNGLYTLTGDTGSPRYMAPEVALGKPYNETVDVYSFGILLHQLCALETPFEGFTVKLFENKVTLGGARPKPNDKWPKEIIDLMRNCWSAKIKDRPSMDEVARILRDEISMNSDEEVSEILDASRKSEMSLRGHG